MIKATFSLELKMSSKANDAYAKAQKFVEDNGYICYINALNVKEISEEADKGVNQAREQLTKMARKAGFKSQDKPDCMYDIFARRVDKDSPWEQYVVYSIKYPNEKASHDEASNN